MCSGGFCEREGEYSLEILSLELSISGSIITSGKSSFLTKNFLKEIREIIFIGISSPFESSKRISSLSLCIFEGLTMLPILTILIVLSSVFGVAQYLISLINFLKALLCRFVIRIHIRMILSCQLAVSLLNFFSGSGLIHPQNFIIINISHWYIEY